MSDLDSTSYVASYLLAIVFLSCVMIVIHFSTLSSYAFLFTTFFASILLLVNLLFNKNNKTIPVTISFILALLQMIITQSLFKNVDFANLIFWKIEENDYFLARIFDGLLNFSAIFFVVLLAIHTHKIVKKNTQSSDISFICVFLTVVITLGAEFVIFLFSTIARY